MIEMGAAAGLKEDEFWSCTPRYLYALQKAKRDESRQSWEQSRYIGFWSLKAMGAKVKRPEQLGKFPWEMRQVVFPKQPIEDLRKFDEEADLILKMTNPEAYERYIKAKEAHNAGD